MVSEIKKEKEGKTHDRQENSHTRLSDQSRRYREFWGSNSSADIQNKELDTTLQNS